MLNKLKSFFQNRDAKDKLSIIFDRSAIWALRILVFVFPVFVLPWPTMPLESMKAHFVLIGALVVFTFTAISVILALKYSIRLHPIIYGLFGFLAISAASALFSGNQLTAFIGIGGREMWSVITILGLTLFAFLIGTLTRRQADFTALLWCLGVGIAFSGIFELMQLAGKFPYPFAFTHQRIWTSVGTPKVFAFISAMGAIIMLIYLRLEAKKINFSVVTAISAILIDFLVLLRIDFYGAWLFLALGALLFSLSTLTAENKLVFWDKYLPIGIFLTALVFTMVGSPLRRNIIPEFNLDLPTSWNITSQSLNGNWFLGTGPGTFEFSYSRYRPTEFNSGEFWNVRFDRPAKHIMTILATMGSAGVIAFLSPYAVLLFVLWKKIRHARSRDPLPFWLGSLAFLFLLSSFFYASNLILVWYSYAVLGLTVATLGKDLEIFKDSRKYRFAVLGVISIMLVFVLRLIIFSSSSLFGESLLARALSIKSSPKERYNNLELAWSYSSWEPRILRSLSRAALQYANEMGRVRDMDGAKIQKLLEKSTASVRRASEVDPGDVENWLALGAVYQNLLPFIEGSGELVVRAYSEALSLEPSNPLPRVEMGKSFLTLGDRMRKDGMDKDIVARIYQRAEEEFIKALNLKADYAPIHFYLGVIYERQGRDNDAILKLEAVERFNPSDAGVAYELGLLYLKKGNLEKAKSEFRRAISNLPAYSDARWQLADVLLREGKPSEAIAELQKILEYNPGNQNVIKAIEEIKFGRSKL